MINASSKTLNVRAYGIYLLPLISVLCYRMLGIDRFLGRLFIGSIYDVQAEGFFINQLVLSGCFLLALIILLSNSERFLQLLKSNWLLILFLIYTLGSCFWSPVPVISLKRWIQFLGIILIGLAAISGPSGAKPVVYVLLWITALSSLYSLFLVLFDPGSSIWPNGQWLGLYTHKNALGGACAVAFAVWLPALTRRFHKKQFNRFAILVIPVTMILLVGSQSATALVVSFTLVLAFFLIKLPIPASVKFFFSPIPVLVLYFFFMNFMTQSPVEYLSTSLGRDATLTGRDMIWQDMLLSIKENPFFGVGYNAFWVGEVGLSSEIFSDYYWNINQAHNGYVDIVNELGFIGLGFFMLVLVQSFFRAFRFIQLNPAEGLTFLLVMLALVISNLAERTFCRQTSLGWFMFLIALVSISQVGVITGASVNKGEIFSKKCSVQGQFIDTS